MAFIQAKLITNVLQKKPDERGKDELLLLETWIRKKSKLFETLKTDVLQDVVKHCLFVSKKRNDPIILQGEKGHNFYIVLRGIVSVWLRDDTQEPLDLDKNQRLQENEREILGINICNMNDGQAFGELALLSEDCVRTASVLAEQHVDLIVIDRELYNRSLAYVVRQEWEEKFNFIEENPLFRMWSTRWRKQLAAALMKSNYRYEDAIVRQGEPCLRMYFILKGEVKLRIDPTAQLEQFKPFIEQCTRYVANDSDFVVQSKVREKEMKLTKLLDHNPLKAQARILRTTPSEQRKIKMKAKGSSETANLCVLGPGQILGDAEMVLELGKYISTAICSQEVNALWLHKAHFDRMFRKKNPHTLKNMLKTLELKMNRRVEEAQAVRAPLYRALFLKTQQMNGTRETGPKDDDNPPETGFISLLKGRPLTLYARCYSHDGRPNSVTHTYMPAVKTRSHHHDHSSEALYRSLLTPISPTDEVELANHPPREGMFLKLMMISDPAFDREETDIEEEELQYLLQLKKRVAREFETLNPLGAIDFMMEQAGGSFTRPCGNKTMKRASHSSPVKGKNRRP